MQGKSPPHCAVSLVTSHACWCVLREHSESWPTLVRMQVVDVHSLFLVCLWPIPSCVQSFLLTLCSWIALGGDCKTICRTHVYYYYLQHKYSTCCAIFCTFPHHTYNPLVCLWSALVIFDRGESVLSGSWWLAVF